MLSGHSAFLTQFRYFLIIYFSFFINNFFENQSFNLFMYLRNVFWLKKLQIVGKKV